MTATNDDIYWRLHNLSKVLEGSGYIDQMQHPDAYPAILDAMNALRAALSAEQEPLGYVSWHTSCPPQFSEKAAGVYRDTATRIEAVYTHPATTVQPLTDEQIAPMVKAAMGQDGGVWDRFFLFARAVERAHGIGGTHG